MGETQIFTPKVSMNSSEQINFQSYIDSVKQRKTPWKIFENFMKDLTYSNIDKLSHLNTILLTELTMNYSALEKSKFLNSILLTELKYSIESKAKFEIIENEIPVSTGEQDSNIVTMKKESEKSEIPIIDIIENENNSKSEKISNKSNDYGEINTSSIQYEKQILNQSQVHANIEEKFCSNEVDDSLNKIKHACDICHKTDSKEIKMDMKKVHHMGKDVTLVTCYNCNKEIMSKLFNCGSCGKTFSHKGSYKMHMNWHHNSSDCIKCDICDKSIINKEMKMHMKNVHLNHKCATLGNHIQTIHQGQKNHHKCDLCHFETLI